jgi:hypothetical protein
VVLASRDHGKSGACVIAAGFVQVAHRDDNVINSDGHALSPSARWRSVRDRQMWRHAIAAVENQVRAPVLTCGSQVHVCQVAMAMFYEPP